MIYEYECQRCGVFEIEQSVKDESLKTCPTCDKDNIISDPPKKLISLSSFQLKGGGWANSGYSNK